MFGLEDVETFPGFQHDSLGRACQEDDIPSTMHVDEVTDGEIPYEYGKDGPSKVRVVVWSDDTYWCKLHVGLLHAASACFALQVQRLCRFLFFSHFCLSFSRSFSRFLSLDWGMFPICRCESSVELLGRGRASKDPLACNLPNSGREISHVLVGTVLQFSGFYTVSGCFRLRKTFQVISSRFIISWGNAQFAFVKRKSAALKAVTQQFGSCEATCMTKSELWLKENPSSAWALWTCQKKVSIQWRTNGFSGEQWTGISHESNQWNPLRAMNKPYRRSRSSNVVPRPRKPMCENVA